MTSSSHRSPASPRTADGGDTPREAILVRRIKYLEANGVRLQEHLNRVKSLKGELEGELLSIEADEEDDDDEDEENSAAENDDDEDDESTPLMGHAYSTPVSHVTRSDEDPQTTGAANVRRGISMPSQKLKRFVTKSRKQRLQAPSSPGEDVGAASSAIMRRIPRMPDRIPTDHFQGHGSDMVLTNDEQVQQNYEVLGVPTVMANTLRNLVFTLAYAVYLLTAWFYCGAVQGRIFPSCSRAWPTSMVGYVCCQASAVLFWTFPLYCMLLTVSFFYWDFLRTELFYQCLAHNVLVDYSNLPFWTAPSVIIALLWLALGCMTYFLSGELDFDRVKLTIPYWIPVLSFGLLFLSSWDIESRLISLQKYLEQDFENSVYHLGSCVFIRDYLLRQGVIAYAEDAQDCEHETSGGYIYALVQAIERLEDGRTFDGGVASQVSTISTRANKQSESLFMSMGSSYWITVFMGHLSAVDSPRCTSFRRCFLFYRVYAFLTIGLIMYLGGVSTVLHHFLHKGDVDQFAWLDSWLGVERDMQRSMAPQTPKLLFLAPRPYI